MTQTAVHNRKEQVYDALTSGAMTPQEGVDPNASIPEADEQVSPQNMRAPHIVRLERTTTGKVDWSIQCCALYADHSEHDGDFTVLDRVCLLKTFATEQPDMTAVSSLKGEHFISEEKLYIVNNDEQGGAVLQRPVLNVCGLWAHTAQYEKDHAGKRTAWLQALIDMMDETEQSRMYLVDVGVGVDTDFEYGEFVALHAVRIIE